MSGKRKKKTKFRGVSYDSNEERNMLDLVEEFKPLTGDEWKKVAMEHFKRYPERRRSPDSLKRKFKSLWMQEGQSGDPYCPPNVQRAIDLKFNVIDSLGASTGCSEDFLGGAESNSDSDSGDSEEEAFNFFLDSGGGRDSSCASSDDLGGDNLNGGDGCNGIIETTENENATEERFQGQLTTMNSTAPPSQKSLRGVSARSAASVSPVPQSVAAGSMSAVAPTRTASPIENSNNKGGKKKHRRSDSVSFKSRISYPRSKKARADDGGEVSPNNLLGFLMLQMQSERESREARQRESDARQREMDARNEESRAQTQMMFSQLAQMNQTTQLMLMRMMDSDKKSNEKKDDGDTTKE